MLFTDTVARLSEPVANLMETGRNPYGLMERLYREHGDMCLYRLAA
ncbi:MAG: hypothetical protein JNM09_31605, partial [Blastocatellia bacterium]|nr:hypothetical protein [Blastocatellia bacterium]